MVDMDAREYFVVNTENDDSLNPKIVKTIYNKLGDEVSKEIFKNRLIFSLTNDWKSMRRVLDYTTGWEHFDAILQKAKKIYIYGSGISGKRLPLLFPEYKWKGYIDKYKKGICNNLPIYDLDYCRNIETEAFIVISNMSEEKSIKEDLRKFGISEERIVCFKDESYKCSSNIYFENELIDKNFEGVFVDIGAYHGEDTVRYFNWKSCDEAAAIIFEPDEKNFTICQDALLRYKNVQKYNLGTSNCEKEVRFSSSGDVNSHVCFEGDSYIKTVALDEILREETVGFIKMDIEGEEAAALLGAKKIIENQKPILAISCYHRREDIWKLPFMILEMNQNYKLYLRHYTASIGDTVLYAV